MSRTALDVLNVARGWLGYNETSGTFKSILSVYNAHKPLARGYVISPTDEWCDAFVSAVAIKAGIVDLIGTEVGVEKHVQIFKAKGIWIEDGTKTPKPGDIIVFNWDSKIQPNDGQADHIGFVEKVTGNNIVTIEGNFNRAVARRYISVGNGFIRGFARPKYASSEAKSTVDLIALAKEVIVGKWGNGSERKEKLIKAGYNPDEVQRYVNMVLTGTLSSDRKSYETIAREVLAGKWGNGSERKEKLIKAGYPPDEIQKFVNKLA